MANLVFNVARGRVRQYYDAVFTSATTTQAGIISTVNSALVVVLLENTGLEADATLVDHDNLSVLLAGSSNEATGGNYARKVLDQSVLVASAETDATNVLDLDIPDQVWVGLTIGTPVNGIGKLLICYDNDSTVGPADASIIPLTCHDFVVSPDGTDVTAQIAPTGFYRSQT